MKNLQKIKSEVIVSSTLYYEKQDIEKFVALFSTLNIIDYRLAEYVKIISELLSSGQFESLPKRPGTRRNKIISLVQTKLALIADAEFRSKMESWFNAAVEEDCDIELQEELLYRYCWAEFLDRVEVLDKSKDPFKEKLRVKPVIPDIGEERIKPLSAVVIPDNEVENGSVVFPTGIEELDDMVKMRKTNFVVIAARTTVGKSLFMINQAINLTKKGTKILYVSLEESDTELKKRVQMHIEDASDSDKKEVLDNFIVFNPTNSSPGSVLGEIEVVTKEEAIEVVFLDYIQLLKYSGMSDWDSLRSLTRELKLFAIKANILLITASQLKREVEYTGSNLAGLYGSSTIEADANVILILEPVRQQNVRMNNIAIVTIAVAKNRNGAQGRVENVTIDYSTGHIIESN